MIKKKSVEMSPTVAFIYALLASLAASVAPMVVRLTTITHKNEQIEFHRPYAGGAEFYDLFAYNKAIFVIFLGVCALITLLITQSAGKINLPKQSDGSIYSKCYEFVVKNVYFVFAALSALFILLSALMSKYTYTAFNGAVERYEGAYVLLAYIILFYVASICIQNSINVKMILYSTIVSSVLIGLIGFTQYIRNDIFGWSWFHKIISHGEPLNIHAVTVYGTFFNPNYMGVYTSMIVPLVIIIALFSPIKSVIKYVSVFSCILMLIALIGSTSRSAYIALPISAIVSIAVYAIAMVRAKSTKLLIRGFIGLFLVLIVGVAAFLAGIGSEKRTQLSNRLTSIFKPSEEWQLSPITDLYYNDNKELVITTIYGQISIGATEVMGAMSYIVKDANGNLLSPSSTSTADDGLVTSAFPINAERNATINKYPSDNYFSLTAGGSPIYILLHNTAGALILDPWGKAMQTIEEAPYFLPFGSESTFSSRGYIWSRSIPLIKNTIILGYGADCYLYEFPQNDPVNKLQHFGNTSAIVDKPHQFYLQWAINNGVLSLIFILIVFACYIITSIRVIIKSGDFKNQWQIYSLAILAAVVGFLVSSFANDSSTSVSPVFWILLGTGVGVNVRLKKEGISKEN